MVSFGYLRFFPTEEAQRLEIARSKKRRSAIIPKKLATTIGQRMTLVFILLCAGLGIYIGAPLIGMAFASCIGTLVGMQIVSIAYFLLGGADWNGIKFRAQSIILFTLSTVSLGGCIGFLLGSLVFPGLGSLAGAAIGSALSSIAVGFIVGVINLITEPDILVEEHTKTYSDTPRKVLSAFILGMSSIITMTAAIGAGFGTFMFPGIGTLMGASLGAAVGTLFSACVGAIILITSFSGIKKSFDVLSGQLTNQQKSTVLDLVRFTTGVTKPENEKQAKARGETETETETKKITKRQIVSLSNK